MGENKFEWTDEKVAEFALQVKVNGTKEWIQPQIEQFKQSKAISVKDFEILTCLSAAGNVHYYNPSACLGADKTVQLCTAHSVKRLSDNQIFTIGDDVTVTTWHSTKPSGKIKEFTIDNGILLVHTEKDICDINWLGKVGEKIKYWYVNHNFKIDLMIVGKDYVKKDRLKYFDTKEAAEQYVIDNKPCLSVKELLNRYSILYVHINSLKQLAQSKIDSK